MTNCPSHDDQGSAHNCEVFKTVSVSSSQNGNVLKVRKGLTLDVPKEFFDDYTLKGSVFKLKTLDLTEEKIAVKWVRKSHCCGFGNHIETLQNAADTTASMITSFTKRVDTKGWDIKVVKPLQGTADNLEIGIEPFIQNMEQFNSNSFWECNALRTYQKLVVALSHFSYAVSKGDYALTNLQGGVDENRKTVILLTPNLVSGKIGKFGCMDIGEAGVFFNEHTCNSFCHDIPRPEAENKEGLRFHFTES